MHNLTEENLTEAVLQKINAEDPRTQAVIASLIKHLHAFIREVEPTEEEWLKGIDFLTRTGQMCDDKRQEFILLSDTSRWKRSYTPFSRRNMIGISAPTRTMILLLKLHQPN